MATTIAPSRTCRLYLSDGTACHWSCVTDVTPSPDERDRIAAVFGLTRDQIAWGHKTPIQHIYGSGPA